MVRGAVDCAAAIAQAETNTHRNLTFIDSSGYPPARVRAKVGAADTTTVTPALTSLRLWLRGGRAGVPTPVPGAPVAEL